MMDIAQKITKIKFYSDLINPVFSRKKRICLCYGREVEKQYDFLKQSQLWSSEELESYQNEKLRRLIGYAYENVPYYKEIFRKNRLHPRDIRRKEDLSKIPVLTKEVIRENFPDKITDRNFKHDRSHIWTTGGSTGEPLRFFGDSRSYDMAWAAYFRMLTEAGYDWGDGIALFWRGTGTHAGDKINYKRFLDWIQWRHVPNMRRINASEMRQKNIEQYIEMLERERPKVLRGYVSALLYLSGHLKGKGADKISPKFITTTAETLTRANRRELERQFSCKVYDQYGCGESYNIGFECGAHNGLHINSEHCIVEILNNGQNAEPADIPGAIAVTDLDNYNMPFIRYLNGDRGRLKGDRCKCGRGLPMMDHVEGRTCDMIKGKNGNVAHSLFFVTLLKELDWFDRYIIKDYEIVQKKGDLLQCNFVTRNEPSRKEVNDFTELCQNHFGDIHVHVEFVNNIMPGVSGKRRNIRSKL